jgi:hypothetical protein
MSPIYGYPVPLILLFPITFSVFAAAPSLSAWPHVAKLLPILHSLLPPLKIFSNPRMLEHQQHQHAPPLTHTTQTLRSLIPMTTTTSPCPALLSNATFRSNWTLPPSQTWHRVRRASVFLPFASRSLSRCGIMLLASLVGRARWLVHNVRQSGE